MGIFSKFVGPGINAMVAQAREDPDAVILDVRTREEFAQGHIEGAVNIPLDEIQETVARFGNKHLYVHCASGARSKRAVAALKAAGVQDAQNIGGIMSWNGPVVTN